MVNRTGSHIRGSRRRQQGVGDAVDRRTFMDRCYPTLSWRRHDVVWNGRRARESDSADTSARALVVCMAYPRTRDRLGYRHVLPATLGPRKADWSGSCLSKSHCRWGVLHDYYV
jgi:hypothetical protein